MDLNNTLAREPVSNLGVMYDFQKEVVKPIRQNCFSIVDDFVEETRGKPEDFREQYWEATRNQWFAETSVSSIW